MNKQIRFSTIRQKEMNSFIRFLGRIQRYQKSFRNYLTFRLPTCPPLHTNIVFERPLTPYGQQGYKLGIVSMYNTQEIYRGNHLCKGSIHLQRKYHFFWLFVSVKAFFELPREL